MSYEFEAVNSPFIMVQMKRFQRLGDRHSKVLSRVHLERVLRIGTERPSYYRLAAIQMSQSLYSQVVMYCCVMTSV
ncbi:hypothetical protein DPMN_163274 [Dreissena polymorpha]|uniref:Uncharacterized protein n=1 Tax=Dreissena polymorpha TaxID=45954 RepID=A0A9D4ESX4_DREPO|nr:hypothetical protein DPMN_163274 [Dreissena polymorpha]